MGKLLTFNTLNNTAANQKDFFNVFFVFPYIINVSFINEENEIKLTEENCYFTTILQSQQLYILHILAPFQGRYRYVILCSGFVDKIYIVLVETDEN